MNRNFSEKLAFAFHISFLACSAFGAVYRAIHKGSGNVLAIKTLPAGDKPADLEREIAILKECKRA